MTLFYRAVLGCFLLLVAFVKPARATHILGGELSYTADTTAAKNPLRYFFKLTLYTDGNSVADNPSATLVLGDGISYTSDRTSRVWEPTTCGIGRVWRNTYYFEHTFAGPGQYTAAYTEVNRSKSIINITHAEEQAFTILAKIYVDVFDVANTAHRPLLPPIFCAAFNQPFRHSLAAFDSNGDSLVYELITPLAATNAPSTSGIQNVTGYHLPDGVSLNARTGELIWPKPDQLGTYTFAVRVSQYRDQRFTGSYMRDFNVNVVAPEDATQSFTIENRAMLPINDQNQINLTVGQPLEIKVKYQTNGIAQQLLTYSDLFFKTQNYTLDTASTDSTITAVLKITLEETWRRRQPYILVFRGNARYHDQLVQQDFTVSLYTQPETISGGGDGNSTGQPGEEPAELFTLYPNPAETFFWIKNNRQSPRSKLFLYNASQQLVLEQELLLKRTRIKLFDVTTGLYFYQILSENNELLQSGKLQVE